MNRTHINVNQNLKIDLTAVLDVGKQVIEHFFIWSEVPESSSVITASGDQEFLFRIESQRDDIDVFTVFTGNLQKSDALGRVVIKSFDKYLRNDILFLPGLVLQENLLLRARQKHGLSRRRSLQQ